MDIGLWLANGGQLAIAETCTQSHSSYNHRCRCDNCCAANNKYWRDLRRTQRDKATS